VTDAWVRCGGGSRAGALPDRAEPGWRRFRAKSTALRPGDEVTPAYTAIRDRLDAFRDANAGVIYVYCIDSK